jgi:hypothetical protein
MPKVLAQARAAAEVRAELARQFGEAIEVVPPGAVSALRKVRIWVEWSRRPDAGAEFHVSRRLAGAETATTPPKAGGIEISNSLQFRQLVARRAALHGVARARSRLPFSRPWREATRRSLRRIDTRWRAGLYESVDYAGGGKRRAYALVNERSTSPSFRRRTSAGTTITPSPEPSCSSTTRSAMRSCSVLWGSAANRESVALSSEYR